jgi:AraC-like DNA-binding protein
MVKERWQYFHARASDLSRRASANGTELSKHPEKMTERPVANNEVKLDVLSDVLRAVRLAGSVYFDFELSSPWVLEAPASSDIVGKIMDAQLIIECHFVAKGSCWAHAVGQEPVRLNEGDLIVFPQGDAHVLTSTRGMRAKPDMARFARPSTPLPMFYELGGGGDERARIVCCFLGCDEGPFNPLLSALPKVIHLQAGHAQGATNWLGTLLSTAAKESRSARAGTENVLARLSELLFVETIREYLSTLPPAETSWLAGLRDPIVGNALLALHREPKKPWTVEALARAVGLSRSVLAERFAEMVGQPPMQYLALWRMQLASRLLSEGNAVAVVASAVGYESEASFSRTFKRLVGQSPASWRRRAVS